MKRSNITKYSICFVVCVLVLLMSSYHSFASSKLSGKVVDEAGKPVSGITITLTTTEGLIRHLPAEELPQRFGGFDQTDSDKDGKFTLENIVPNVPLLLSFPKFPTEPDYDLHAINIEGIDLYINPSNFRYDGLLLKTEPDAEVKNVVLTVRPRMRIRGRVLAIDKTSLKNENVKIAVVGERSRGSRDVTLDEDGGFVWYLRHPGTYTIKVTYAGKAAQSKPHKIQEGQQIDGLSLKLSEDVLQDIEQPLPQPMVKIEKPAEFNHEHRRNFLDLQREGVWIINPENRHAYKKVKCESIVDAKEIAQTNDATLVAINNEKEQKWIFEVYKEENYWIGLKAGAEKWDSGEPVTYTNWLNKEISTKEFINNTDYVILLGKIKAWDVAHKGSPNETVTKHAILEKDRYILEELVPDADNINR